MTKSDLIDWKHHPITKEVFSILQKRVHVLQETLGTSAGIDPLQDRYMVGAIQAYNDMLLVDFDPEESND